MSALVRIRGARRTGERCPYCREVFLKDGDRAAERVLCTECHTPHHATCFREHGRCTTHGCRGCHAPSLRYPSRARRLGRLVGQLRRGFSWWLAAIPLGFSGSVLGFSLLSSGSGAPVPYRDCLGWGSLLLVAVSGCVLVVGLYALFDTILHVRTAP